jgi:hypothetical protein
MEARHDALRHLGADAEESLEGALRNRLDLSTTDGNSVYLHERPFGEVDVRDKRLH